MNSVCLMGRLYGEPRTNVGSGDGKASYIKFTVGVYNFYKKEVEFFNCVSFGKTAEIVARFFEPKRAVAVMGHLNNSKYVGKSGKEITTTGVTVTNFTLPLDGSKDGASQSDERRSDDHRPEDTPSGLPQPDSGGDLPF